jgi:hypothetical protein
VEQPKVDPVEVSKNNASWADILTRDFKDMLPAKPEAPSEAKPDEKKAEPVANVAPPENLEKTAEPTPEPAKVSRKSNANLENVIQETIRKEMAKLPLPEKAPSPAKQVEEKKEEPDLTGWMPEEVEAFELAQFAETTQPDRYKGQADKLIKFRKAVNDYIEKAQKSDPERTFDVNDPDFMAWKAQNEPSYQPGDTVKLERQRIEASAVKRAKSEMQADLDKQQEEIKALRFEPTIERQGKAAEQAMTKLVAEDDFMKSTLEAPEKLGEHLARAQEVGVEKAVEDLPLPDRLTVATFHSTAQIAKELLGLEYSVKKWNPNDPGHQWLGRFVQTQDQTMQQMPQAQTMRDGKRFVPRAEFQRIAAEHPDQANNVWTWTTADLLNMLAINAKTVVTEKIKRAVSDLEKAGWQRTPKAAKTPVNPQTPIEPAQVPVQKSPKASSQISPGAATESGKATAPPAMDERYLRARGYTK